MAALLLRAALLRMAMLLQLLRRPVLLLRSALHRLRCSVAGRLRLGGLGRPLRRALFHRPFLRTTVVLDVEDPALCVQGRGHLALPLALAAPPPAAAPVPAEPPPSTALGLLTGPELDVGVAVHRRLRITGIAGLRGIRRGLRGVRWCGGTLSFSIHLLSSITTSSAGG